VRTGGQRVPVGVEIAEMAPELADVSNGVLVTWFSWFLNIGAVRLGISRAVRLLEQRQLRSMATRFAAVVEQG
jgi:hypothetical protein